MRTKRIHFFLMLIFLFILFIRLFFAFQTSQFAKDESYFNLRQIENIRHTGIPLYADPLSYGGRHFVFFPLFQYLVAMFSIIMPVAIAAKIIPAICASSIVFIIYLITKEITENDEAALFSSFLAAFVPIFIKETVNVVNVDSLQVPLIFLLFYFFIKIDKAKKYIYFYLIVLLIAASTSSAVFIFLLSVVFYLMVSYVENMEERKAKLEVVIFSAFFIVWLNFLIYKRAFLINGPSMIWQNIPSQMIAEFFSRFDILDSIYQIGILPFIFGIALIFMYLFKRHINSIYLFACTTLSILFLLWLKLISLNTGLVFLSFTLIILFSQFYKNFFGYFEKTKIAKYRNTFVFCIIILVTITSVIPSLLGAHEAVAQTAADNQTLVFTWIKENTENDSTILTPIEEGHILTEMSNRKNVMDSNFLLIPDINQRYDDVHTIYTTISETEAVSLLVAYDIEYILVSPLARSLYSISDLKYIGDETCFAKVYDDGQMMLYKSLCKIETFT